MSIAIGRHVGVEVAEALGLDKNKLRRIDIKIHCNELVIIETQSMIEVDDLRKVTDIIKKYKLVEIKEKDKNE